MATNATTADQSSKDLGRNAIALASAQNRWLFVAYMACIVGAALLTYLLWQSGNAVQDAIVADANARIGEADSKAASANERAGKLENDNLKLRGEIADAQRDAAEAQHSTAEVAEKLELEKQNTARFQKEADVARLALDTQIRLQGPRSRLLMESREALIERLKPFKGQYGVVVVCGPVNAIDAEKTGAMNALLDILADGHPPDNAGWNMDLRYDERCTGAPSIAVFIGIKASEVTRKAGDVLVEALKKVIPRTAASILSFDPETPGAIAYRDAGYEGAYSVRQSLRDHPDWVVISLGPHP